MGKPIIPQTYRFGDNRVEILPYFLYEISIYKITKNMVAIMASKFYKSDKPLTIKEEVTIKKYKDYSIVRSIDVLGVTKEFVEENNLPIYKLKRKKNERTH